MKTYRGDTEEIGRSGHRNIGSSEGNIPPLRERPEDIPPLVRHFAQEFARRMNKTIESISDATIDALIQYPWPGNIRELQNVIERSVVLHQKGKLSLKKSFLAAPPSHPGSGASVVAEIRGKGSKDD